MNRTINTMDELRNARVGERVDVGSIIGATYAGLSHEGLPLVLSMDGDGTLEVNTVYILRVQNPRSQTFQNKFTLWANFRKVHPNDPNYQEYSGLVRETQ